MIIVMSCRLRGKVGGVLLLRQLHKGQEIVFVTIESLRTLSRKYQKKFMVRVM